MRILYCGKLDVGSTSLSRFQAINELGNHVLPIDVSNYIPKNRILRGLQSKQLFSFNIIKLNRDLYAKALLGEPDIIWIDKGTMIKPEILKKIKKKINVKIVHYNTDDIFNHKHNFSNYFKSINYYDFHFTSNIHNVKELKSITNKDIFFNDIGYDHNFYKPSSEQSEIEVTTDVLFVGHYEQDYYDSIKDLLGDFDLKIYGPGWNKVLNKEYKHHHISNGAWGEKYVKCIRKTKIAIGLVSSINRNDTSGRLFEIPATGTLLIAKRNKVLESLYVENKEAVFFDTSEELKKKVKYYLLNKEERNKIAKNGRERCLANKCSWHDRIVEIMYILKKEIL